MAIATKTEEKKQKLLLILLIIIILLIIFVGYFSFFYSPREKMKSIPSFRKIKIDFSIFEREIFKNLQPFIEIPSFEGKFGRENPFIPYEILKE